MAFFTTDQEVYDVLGGFFNASSTDDLGQEIQKSGLVIQFEISDPDCVLTIDTKSAETGEYFRVIEGSANLEPDVRLSMKADTANKFWLGKLNLFTAVALRQVVVHGSAGKLMGLIPVMQPAYQKYQAYLYGIGREDLSNG